MPSRTQPKHKIKVIEMPKPILTGLDVVIPVTYNACPESMNADSCPLRKHVASGKTVFYQDEDKLLLTQSNKSSWEEIRANIEQMYEICTKCQMENKQKTK